MSERQDSTPATLYARVSTNREDMDLSVAAHLGALLNCVGPNGDTLLHGQGGRITEASPSLGASLQTSYRWGGGYGGVGIDDAGRLKRLGMETSRLKRAAADLALDNQILREAKEKRALAFQ